MSTAENQEFGPNEIDHGRGCGRNRPGDTDFVSVAHLQGRKHAVVDQHVEPQSDSLEHGVKDHR